jgi:hypothetical protein
MLSRSFHYQLKQSERQALLGPAENTREHVVAAARAMLNGDWSAAVGFIVNDKMNAKVRLFYILCDIVVRVGVESVSTQGACESSSRATYTGGNIAYIFIIECNNICNCIIESVGGYVRFGIFYCSFDC